MVPVTLALVQAKQSELAALIEQLQAHKPIITVVDVHATSIELSPGEHYAGTVLGADCKHKHHLVLMAAKPERELDWDAAMAWATAANGSLPTRQEQALLYANCKPHLKPEWHWSSEQHESEASFAWYCYFGSGLQDSYLKSYEGSAVCVRRV